MVTSIELYPYDFVIVKSNGELYNFEDGETIIYAKRDTALMDSKKFPGSKVVSTTKLSRKSRKQLRKNIKEFSKPPY